jgi:hypothetical protein
MLKNIYIVRCMSNCRSGLGLEIGCIDHLQVVSISSYNNISNFHTSQITTAHAKFSQPGITSRRPVTVLNNGDFFSIRSQLYCVFSSQTLLTTH